MKVDHKRHQCVLTFQMIKYLLFFFFQSTEEHQNDFSFDNQLYDQSPTFSHSDA